MYGFYIYHILGGSSLGWVFFSIFCIGQAVYGHKGSYSKDKKKKSFSRGNRNMTGYAFFYSVRYIYKKKKICL